MRPIKEFTGKLLHYIKCSIKYGITHEERSIIEYLRHNNLTYCGYPKLENLCLQIRQIKRNEVPGIFLETGVALGGSAILMGKLKPQKTPLCLFDVFGMIPAPSEIDEQDVHQRYAEIIGGNSIGIGGQKYYGYINNIQEVVRQNITDAGLDLSQSKISLIPGLFEDTLHLSQPIAIAHIDCDWYESVRVCIERIVPVLSTGGILIFDDYDSYSGCRKAVDDWLLRDNRFIVANHHRSLSVQKLAI